MLVERAWLARFLSSTDKFPSRIPFDAYFSLGRIIFANYLTVFFCKSINYHDIFFRIIFRSRDLIRRIDFLEWKACLRSKHFFARLENWIFLPITYEHYMNWTSGDNFNFSSPSRTHLSQQSILNSVKIFRHVCYPIPSTKLEINRPIGEQLLLYLKRDLNSNRGSEKIGGIFSSSVVRSHRVSICSGNEITIGRLPSRLCKGRVLSSNSASWNANSWYRRHNRFQILDSPGRQGTCWRNWFARDQIRGSYLSFFLFLLVRKQDV